MAQRKVLFIIAFDGFQQVEYSVPRKLLIGAGYDVLTASNKAGIAIAKDGSSAKVNVTLKEVQVSDYDAIVFIGGPGTLENLNVGDSYTIAQEAYESKIPLGAICLATRVLVHSGVLRGKKATGWDGDGKFGELCVQEEVQYQKNEAVVIDQNIITAVGPSAAEMFGNGLLKLIESKR
jgi:protease I